MRVNIIKYGTNKLRHTDFGKSSDSPVVRTSDCHADDLGFESHGVQQ